MPTVIPYVPQRITVHLGAPSASADNVTVSFSDYVKMLPPVRFIPPGRKAPCGPISWPLFPLR